MHFARRCFLCSLILTSANLRCEGLLFRILNPLKKFQALLIALSIRVRNTSKIIQFKIQLLKLKMSEDRTNLILKFCYRNMDTLSHEKRMSALNDADFYVF